MDRSSSRLRRNRPHLRLCTPSSIGTTRTPRSSRSATGTRRSPKRAPVPGVCEDPFDHRRTYRELVALDNGRPGRDPAPASPSPRGHPRRDSRPARRSRSRSRCARASPTPNRMIEAARARPRSAPGIRELRLLPARRQGEVSHRRGSHRRAAHHPHQEQPGPERHRLEGAGQYPRVAPGPRSDRGRPPRLRRRPPQVRPRLVLHGAGGGGARLDQPHHRPGRLRVRRAGYGLLPFPQATATETSKSSTRRSSTS